VPVCVYLCVCVCCVCMAWCVCMCVLYRMWGVYVYVCMYGCEHVCGDYVCVVHVYIYLHVVFIFMLCVLYGVCYVCVCKRACEGLRLKSRIILSSPLFIEAESLL